VRRRSAKTVSDAPRKKMPSGNRRDNVVLPRNGAVLVNQLRRLRARSHPRRRPPAGLGQIVPAKLMSRRQRSPLRWIRLLVSRPSRKNKRYRRRRLSV
jgi:hypothetical protein